MEEDKKVVPEVVNDHLTEKASVSLVVAPAISADVAIKQFRAFAEIKNRVLVSEDKLPVNGKPFIRKTGWRKIKTIFNLSEEILSSRRELREEKDYSWIYKVRVMAPNGVFADAEMSCDSTEEFAWQNKAKDTRKPECAIMAMAQTRAFNRAISDLVGGGECSAEEIGESREDTIPKDTHEFVCSECNAKISKKVYDYSQENNGKALCMTCQKKAMSQ